MSEKIIDMELEKLIPYARNPRKNDHAVDRIASAIREFGFKVPVIAKSDGTVVDGHLRLKAAQKLGMEAVPVLLADDLSDAQIKAFRLSVNKMAELAEWDDELLHLELDELRDIDFDLDLTGFDQKEIDDIFADTALNIGLTDPDDVPTINNQQSPITKPGDVWLLGKHRLMCGDSTSVDNFEKLMSGEKADIVFTSPPYNVGKTPNGSNDSKYANSKDDKNASEYLELLIGFSNASLLYADYLFCNVQSVAGNKVALIDYLKVMQDKYADTIIWDKETSEPAMARRVLNSQFEYIHIFSHDANRVVGRRDFRGTQSNVFRLNSRSGKQFAKIHKATFRVEFPQHFIENFTESSVIDPFGGTGTTMIAAEKLGRKSFLMELDPKYCDVIIKRWQEFTGKQAILEADGRLFCDLEAEE